MRLNLNITFSEQDVLDDLAQQNTRLAVELAIERAKVKALGAELVAVVQRHAELEVPAG